IVVLALGIGATTIGFVLLDHVLLRPLPFPDAKQLVMIYQTDHARGYARIEASPPNYTDWRAMNHSFSAMAAYAGPGFITLSGHGEPARVGLAMFTADVLPTLDVQPVAGRAFTSADDRESSSDAVLVSSRLATTLFGSAGQAVGQTVTLDNRPRPIVGVLPRGFAFPARDV